MTNEQRAREIFPFQTYVKGEVNYETIIEAMVKMVEVGEWGSHFYCQSDIENDDLCSEQCDHCKSYYAPLESQESTPQPAPAGEWREWIRKSDPNVSDATLEYFIAIIKSKEDAIRALQSPPAAAEPRGIEQLTDEDLQELWPAIGGTPHLFEFGKDELKQVLTTGECGIEYEFGGELKVEPIGLQLDYYTMAAIVDILRSRGFETEKI